MFIENHSAWIAIAAIGWLVVIVLACIAGLTAKRQRGQIQTLSSQLHESELAARFTQAQIESSQERVQRLEHELAHAQQVLRETSSALTAERVQRQEAAKHHQQALAIQKQQAEQIKQEFENLANAIFEQKTERFKQQSQASLAATLQPLKEQIGDFKRKVEDAHVRDVRQRQSLLEEILHLKSLNQQMSQDAINLTQALKSDTKAQGNWGEVILERVLEESGLRKGHEYHTQAAHRGADGKRYQPDVIVNLPDKKHIVIDSKMSLVSYEQYCQAEDESQKKAYLKAHINSVKQHVNGIVPKHYENLTGVNSLDFILVFIPIEPAFLLVFEHDYSLFSDAYARGVIIVSPTTLLAVLRTVQSLWRHERQNKNVEEIARIAGALHDTILRVLESAEDVGRHLEKAQDAQQKMVSRLSQGRGNLLKTASRLAELGANTKKQLPHDSQFHDGEETL